MSNKKPKILAITLAALGVVYGDIGTSPLYALNEIFFGRGGVNPSNIIGLISLVIWALILMAAVKFVILIINADNDGEGGVFALAALLQNHKKKSIAIIITMLIFSAGLLFGDGIITPAISVLSAVEGLKVIAPSTAAFVVPITIFILTLLFMAQRHGTTTIGKVFGPIILLWFIAIACIGAMHIPSAPQILKAFNPLEAVNFIYRTKPYELLLILGSVILVITGGEALYADMGHFGKRPIRLSWFFVVLPCLILNYLGQGAYLLSAKPIEANNIFFSLVPHKMLLPMIMLATMATIIASQALISGAFSLATQGIALGLLPRFRIKHTHKHHEGQIYVGLVNWVLYAGCLMLVIFFKSSSNLAAAYGLAVTAVMLVTAIAVMQLAVLHWHWSRAKSLLVFGFFALVDLAFLVANSLKFLDGGYVPITVGILFFGLMSTWRWGRAHVRRTFLSHSTMKMSALIKIKNNQPRAKSSNLLVLTVHNTISEDDPVPPLLELFLKKFRHMPQHIILLTIAQTKRPYERRDRLDVTVFENNHSNDSSLISVRAKFGFNEEPNVEKVIDMISSRSDLVPSADMSNWIVYAGRERIFVAHPRGLHPFRRFRGKLYKFMVRNATPSYDYYGLSSDSRLTIELVPVHVD